MINIDVIKAFVYSIELRDIYTRGHSERVAVYAKEFAKFLGLDEDLIYNVYIAGLLHDLGKVGIPDAILLKPGKLEKDEYEIIKMHSILSGDIVAKLGGLEYLAKIVRHHHEHFDGSGYPDRLRGEEIPLLSRILTIVDVFDALTTKRVYRAAMSKEVALEIMEKIKSEFDPILYDKFKKFIKNFEILKIDEFHLEKNVEKLIENNVYFIDLNFKTLNREGIIAILKKSADLGFRGSLISLNIKKFREYNRKNGSKQGDFILKEVIKEIKKIFKAKVSLEEPKNKINYLGRINADKFFIFSIGCSSDILKNKLEKLINRINDVVLEYSFVFKNETLKKYRNKIDYLI